MRQVVYISDQPRLIHRIPLDLVRDRDLLWALIRRDITLRFGHPSVALAWVVFQPLILAAALTFVFTVLVDVRGVDPGAESRLQYAALVLTALVPWFWTANVLLRAPDALTANANLIRKTGFAREVAPLSVVISGLGACLISGAVLFALLSIFIALPNRAYAALPIVLFIQLVMLSGAARLLALTNVYFRDVPSIARFLVGIGFFLTPIVYTMEAVRTAFADAPVALGWAKPLYYANPCAGLTEAYRQIMVFGEYPTTDILIWPAVAAMAVFIIGLVLFRRQAPTIADNL